MFSIHCLLKKIRSGLFKKMFIYILADGLSKALSFLILPLVSIYLVPEQLGIDMNFNVLQGVLMLLSGQALIGALPYFYYERTREQVGILIFNLLVIIVVSLFLFSIVIVLFTSLIEEYFYIGIWLQLLTIISAFSQFISTINTQLYRLEEKPKIFGFLQILQCVVYLVLLVTLVVVFKLEAVGKIMSLVVSFSLMMLVHLVLLKKRRYIVFRIDFHLIKDLLKYGLPLLPHALSFWVKGGMDKILITTYCGLSANGLYSMALSFGGVYSIFSSSFSNAFVPYLQQRIRQITPENALSEKRSIVRLSYKICMVFMLLCIVLVCVCWVAIHYLLSSQYEGSFQFIPSLMISLTIYSFYSLVIQYPYTMKKTKWLGIITFCGSIVQLLITYVLVSTIGIDGVKYSLVFGAVVIVAGVWWYSNRVYPMPWFSSKINNK